MVNKVFPEVVKSERMSEHSKVVPKVRIPMGMTKVSLPYVHKEKFRGVKI